MKIVIVAGGTGGHIYPGIALAEALGPIHDVLFIATTHGLERDILNKEGIKFKTIAARALMRKISYQSFSAPLLSIVGFFQSLLMLYSFRPKLVVSMGGYASFPVALAAYILKIPVYIHEQNAVPGFSNKFCSVFAKKIFVSFKESQNCFGGKRVIVTGNPVRKKVLTVKKEEARQKLGIPKDKKVILVVGGSQGAKKINETVLEMLPLWGDNETMIYHITGTRDFAFVKDSLKQSYPFYTFVAYRDDIWNAVAAADIVVSRAGATLIAEIRARGTPAVLIPYPFAANFHQDRNAELMQKEGSALIVKNNELTPRSLMAAIKEAYKLKPTPFYLNAAQEMLSIINEHN